MWTKQVILKNIYVYVYVCMHSIIVNQVRGHEFEREREGYMGGLEGRKWKGEMMG